MRVDDESRNWIYDRTNGRCHLCGKKLSFQNYASPGEKGVWEIEHSRPRARGGTNYLRNLFPACISCNRSKGTTTSRTVRGWKGRKRAPLSREKKAEVRKANAVVGGTVGTILGALIAGPAGFVLGGVIGVAIGHGRDPDSA